MSTTVIEGNFRKREIPKKEQGNIGVTTTSIKASANVQALLSASRIPWVRQVYQAIQGRDSFYRTFFDGLLSIRQVTISDDTPQITLASVMHIEDKKTGAEWELGVDTFARFLEIPPGAILDSELPGYIASLLNVADIDFALHQNTSSGGVIRQKIIKFAQLKKFPPKELYAAQRNGQKIINDFEVSLNLEDPEAGAYTSTEGFRDPCQTPVLFMMLRVMYEAMGKGFSPESTMEVGIYKNTRRGEILITLTFAEMCEEVDKAILRKWPLYANYSDSTLVRNMVYEKHVVPGIEDEGEE